MAKGKAPRTAFGAKGGNVINKRGRPKGVPNKSTTLARTAIAKLVDGNAPKLMRWLDKIEKEEGTMAAWKCLMDVIEYHIPKLQRLEHTAKDGASLLVTLKSQDEANL